VVLAAAAVMLAGWVLRERSMHAGFHWAEFAASFEHLRWQWIAAALLIGMGSYYGRALRWAVMLKPLQPEPNIWNIFKATCIGFTALVLLGRPGEVVRPYLISIKERVTFSSQVAAWVLERLCDLVAVLLLFGFALSQIKRSRANLGPVFRWVLETGGYTVGILSVVCIVLLVMMGRFSGVMQRRLLDALKFLPQRHQSRAAETVSAFMDGTAATKTQASVLKLSLYSALEWALIVLCFACIFRSCPETSAFTLQDVLIFVGFVAFGSILQIPGVGGGVQLVSLVVLTQLYRTSLEVATSLAIMIWFITFVGIVPLGLLCAFQEGFNWRRIREIEKCALRAEPPPESGPTEPEP
jgi:glycosyltransferase 2 family protein